MSLSNGLRDKDAATDTGKKLARLCGSQITQEANMHTRLRVNMEAQNGIYLDYIWIENVIRQVLKRDRLRFKT